MSDATDRPKCEACGLTGMGAYVRVRTTNGGLTLCRACLDDVNRKNPEVSLHRAKANGKYWAWGGSGEDHLESLVCPVLIPAADLRSLTAERDWLAAEVAALRGRELAVVGDDELIGEFRLRLDRHQESDRMLAELEDAVIDERARLAPPPEPPHE